VFLGGKHNVKGNENCGAELTFRSEYESSEMCWRMMEISWTDRVRSENVLDCVRNMMEHVQKPNFVFRRNGRVHLNRRGRQFSRLLAADVCASAVVMLDTPCSEVV